MPALVATLITVLAVVTASAIARSPLHGQTKINVIQDSESADAYFYPLTNWQILHCMGGYRSTVRRNWADWYFTGDHNGHYVHGCASVGFDGLTVAKQEQGFWTPVSEFDGASKPCYVGSYSGQPKMPWGVVDDLFRIRCPTNAFGRP